MNEDICVSPKYLDITAIVDNMDIHGYQNAT